MQAWLQLSAYAFVRFSILSPYVFVYFRGAQKPNAGLGYNHASMVAALGLRICAFLNSLALRVCAILNYLAFQVLEFFQCHLGHRTGSTLQRVT